MARVLAFVSDLMLASRVEATLAAAGHRVTVESSVDAAEFSAADLIVVDVGDVDPESVVGRGAPVLGFCRHTDVTARRRAESAGVDLVVPRSRLAREMPELVRRLLSGDE